MTCAIEWCDDRAQNFAVDGQRYCKKHSNWNQTRKGFRCARMLLEDYKDSQHPLYSCSTKPDGTFDGKCNDCQALHFKTECVQVASGADGKKCTLCCAHGRAAHLPKPTDAPGELQELLKSASFCDNIRRYNAATGFVSFGDASGGSAATNLRGRGPPVYVLHGQVYHRISVLLPSGNKDPSHGQLYIYDPDEAADRRVKLDPGLEKRCCEKLHRMLMDCQNPYVAAYRHMYEQLRTNEQYDDTQAVLRLRSGDTPDPRRYNEPSGRDIAAVFTGDNSPSRRENPV